MRLKLNSLSLSSLWLALIVVILCQPSSAESSNFSDWSTLVSLRPPVEIQQDVNGRGIAPKNWFFHRIEDSAGDDNGPTNLDYYSVTIKKLPIIQGNSVSANDFLMFVRLNLGSKFLDTSVASFSPYFDAANTSETAKWNSTNPLGAIAHFAIHLIGAVIPVVVNPSLLDDNAAVAVAEYAPDHWIFSTLWTTADFGHPVSGNREFGIRPQPDGSFIFYTRGADRPTSQVDLNAQRASGVVFNGANKLWISLQQKVADFVNTNGGQAEIGPVVFSVSGQKWGDVKQKYYRPTTPWLSLGGTWKGTWPFDDQTGFVNPQTLEMTLTDTFNPTPLTEIDGSRTHTYTGQMTIRDDTTGSVGSPLTVNNISLGPKGAISFKPGFNTTFKGTLSSDYSDMSGGVTFIIQPRGKFHLVKQ